MLKITDLSIRYKDTSQLVLDKINIDVKKGQIVAIIGPSGCGKTTLLNNIANVLTEGEVTRTGELKLVADTKIRMVFQEPILLPWRKVTGNIFFGLEAEGKSGPKHHKKVKEVVKLVGLDKSEDKYPHQLSIGMKQRVNFARALATNPDLLLLDEPFSALDIETKTRLRSEFLKILKQKKITAIFVTHDLEEACLLADKIVVLTDGPAKVEKVITRAEFKKVPDDLVIKFNPFMG
jgi:NitT/TauT family transport system ATP-binding protein